MRETDRVAAVLAAIQRLRARDAGPLSQGLSSENARFCLSFACDAITDAGLRTELATPGRRPAAVAVICAEGVFTAPLEWVALLAAAGCRVWLKPPSAAPDLCAALAEDLVAEGLPVALCAGRDIPAEAEAILAFGGDQTMADLAAAYPARRLALNGHRFSAAIVDADGDLAALATALATDHALYDTRGCMAPVAIFASGEVGALADALAEAMAEAQAVFPRGAVDAASGPIFRERMGLARALGRGAIGAGWAVLTLPTAHFLPVALPRTATIHPVQSADEIAAVLDPWRSRLSSCATNLPVVAARLGFPRVCAPGRLQLPDLPRLHDGRPMLGSVVLG